MYYHTETISIHNLRSQWNIIIYVIIIMVVTLTHTSEVLIRTYCLAKITSAHAGLRNNMTNLKWLALTIAIESFVCLRIYSSLTEVQFLSSLISTFTGMWSVFKTQIVLYLAIYHTFFHKCRPFTWFRDLAGLSYSAFK